MVKAMRYGQRRKPSRPRSFPIRCAAFLCRAQGRKSGVKVTVSAEAAAKLAVLEAFAASSMSKSELARRLGVRETEARRILDPMHATKLPRLQEALVIFGKRLVVGVEEIQGRVASYEVRAADLCRRPALRRRRRYLTPGS
jgi:hypothetical protein